jgi:hypothetical protein
MYNKFQCTAYPQQLRNTDLECKQPRKIWKDNSVLLYKNAHSLEGRRKRNVRKLAKGNAHGLF